MIITLYRQTDRQKDKDRLTFIRFLCLSFLQEVHFFGLFLFGWKCDAEVIIILQLCSLALDFQLLGGRWGGGWGDMVIDLNNLQHATVLEPKTFLSISLSVRRLTSADL